MGIYLRLDGQTTESSEERDALEKGHASGFSELETRVNKQYLVLFRRLSCPIHGSLEFNIERFASDLESNRISKIKVFIMASESAKFIDWNLAFTHMTRLNSASKKLIP